MWQSHNRLEVHSTQLPHQLIAMDPQRLGTPTTAYDLHFQEESLQRKHDLMNRGFLTVEYLGKREQLPASSKGSQISPFLFFFFFGLQGNCPPSVR